MGSQAMSALAPFSPWIPEDDILLKDAVEAGASLESLAKGAVHFSRRFTIRELQDRWYSLLYDPVVSANASARMVEFECSTPTLPIDRPGNSKETNVNLEREKLKVFAVVTMLCVKGSAMSHLTPWALIFLFNPVILIMLEMKMSLFMEIA
ncbi:uncharacterized protein Pyn_11576 [Prunus yedoensis var. nudiflora]|uniref:Microspherule protein N-terminal domain-containing protein n=1 Tax=Prunus yedoensis var. nudiflora TaxID=2094558 RepID=A0A314UV01_PRUYE|nr:uncharacterized protein Pyn_11576 [Prunus yedoensis var. nudiflora]